MLIAPNLADAAPPGINQTAMPASDASQRLAFGPDQHTRRGVAVEKTGEGFVRDAGRPGLGS